MIFVTGTRFRVQNTSNDLLECELLWLLLSLRHQTDSLACLKRNCPCFQGQNITGRNGPLTNSSMLSVYFSVFNCKWISTLSDFILTLTHYPSIPAIKKTKQNKKPIKMWKTKKFKCKKKTSINYRWHVLDEFFLM